jgi:hypothetical protein
VATPGDLTARSKLFGSGVVGPYRDRSRWFDRFESEKRGDASGADAGKGAKHVLEFTSVNGGNVQQHVVGSGDGVGAQHIRHAVQSPCELGITGFGMFSKGDQHEGFDAQSDLLVINDGSDSLDSAVAAELLDPSQSGGGRKPETSGELDVRQVAAYL